MGNMGRPKSEDAKRKILSIRMTDSLYQQLQRYAEDHHMTMTEVALQGLEKTISENQ